MPWMASAEISTFSSGSQTTHWSSVSLGTCTTCSRMPAISTSSLSSKVRVGLAKPALPRRGGAPIALPKEPVSPNPRCAPN